MNSRYDMSAEKKKLNKNQIEFEKLKGIAKEIKNLLDGLNSRFDLSHILEGISVEVTKSQNRE